MKNVFVVAAAFICFATLFSGCEKKEIQGPKGEAGAPGGGGNTNINTSETFYITESQWKPNSDTSAVVAAYTSTLLTKDVVNKGSVKVYMFRGNAWWELPFAIGDLFMQFGFKEGVVELAFMDIHGALPDKPETANYRIVTITQAGKTATTEGILNQDHKTVIKD